jgi:hypothetical protein
LQHNQWFGRGEGGRVPARDPRFESRSKYDLVALCDRLLADDPDAVEECVAFLEAETARMWHGRARAVMARRLKHRPLSACQRDRAARAVLGRLTRGQFSEGFKDQLRPALRLDPGRAFAAARAVPADAPEHVRRYAAWVLAHEPDRRAAPGGPPDPGSGEAQGRVESPRRGPRPRPGDPRTSR